MPSYTYTARTADGRIIHGHQEAETEHEAIRILQGRDLFITRISTAKVKGETAAKVAKKRRRRSVKPEDQLFLIGELATLLDAGIPILRSLEVISEQTQSQGLYQVLTQIKADIKAGSTLKDAFARHPKTFPSVWIHLIEAGEASGNLPLVLHQLAEHLEANITLTKKLVSALVYPCVLLVVALGALLVFMLVIIPIFAKLFASFKAELPPLTRVIIGISNFLQHYIVHFAVAIAVSVVLLRRYAQTAQGQKTMDGLVLRAPIFGQLFRDTIAARICINLATLIRSGINILRGIEITARASGNVLYEASLVNTAHMIQQGRTLSSCLEEDPLFPSLMVHMIIIGEESGKLPDMIARSAKYYQDRVDVFVSRLGVLIEPIILVLVGGLVGVLVVSMFLPIFSLSSVIK